MARSYLRTLLPGGTDADYVALTSSMGREQLRALERWARGKGGRLRVWRVGYEGAREVH
jgi:hypothetical protein